MEVFIVVVPEQGMGYMYRLEHCPYINTKERNYNGK